MIDLNDFSQIKYCKHPSGEAVNLDTVNINSLQVLADKPVNGGCLPPHIPTSRIAPIPTGPTPLKVKVVSIFNQDEIASILTLNNLAKGRANPKQKMHLRTVPVIQPEMREEQEITELSPLFQRSNSTKNC